MRVWEEEQQEIAEELGDGKMIKLDFWNDNKTVFWVNYNNYCHVIVSWVKAGSFPVLAPGGGHFPPQMLPVLEHQVRMIMMVMVMIMMVVMMKWATCACQAPEGTINLRPDLELGSQQKISAPRNFQRKKI